MLYRACDDFALNSGVERIFSNKQGNICITEPAGRPAAGTDLDNSVEDSSTETMAELANRVARCRPLGTSPFLCNIVYRLQHTDMY